MKQLILIILISFFFIQNVSSQRRDNVVDRFIVKVMPLSVIDFTPRYRFGLEYVTAERMAYSIDVGLGSSYLNKWRLTISKWGQNYSFYEIRPEVKYMFFNREGFYFYSAVELFYMEMEDYLENGHYKKEFTLTDVNYDSAVFNKQKYGVHIKGGINLIAGRFNFDFYGGIGIAERIIIYTDVVLPVSGYGAFYEEFDFDNYLYEGTTLTPHIAFGFKIGYTI